MNKHDRSKRQFMKTAAYVAPAILTLTAVPSFASSGSGREGHGGHHGHGGRDHHGGHHGNDGHHRRT